VKDNLVGGKF